MVVEEEEEEEAAAGKIMGERRKIIWEGFRVSALFSVKSVVDGPTIEPRVQQMLRAIFYYHVHGSRF